MVTSLGLQLYFHFVLTHCALRLERGLLSLEEVHNECIILYMVIWNV